MGLGDFDGTVGHTLSEELGVIILEVREGLLQFPHGRDGGPNLGNLFALLLILREYPREDGESTDHFRGVTRGFGGEGHGTILAAKGLDPPALRGEAGMHIHLRRQGVEVARNAFRGGPRIGLAVDEFAQ